MQQLREWRDAIVDFPASTRSVGLMRIGFALVGWAEFGNAAQPHRADTPAWLALLFYVSTFLMVIGFRSRLATLAGGTVFALAISRIPGAMHHHTYLLAFATLLLALTPCDRSFSLDRWLAVRRARRANAPLPDEHGNLWALRLIGLQMSAVFFWGGYNKLTLGTRTFQTAFISGDRLEQVLVYYYELPSHPPAWLSAAFAVMATSVVIFELTASVALWLPRLRPWFLVGCVLLTSSFQVLLSVGTFGALSYILYLSFLPPAQVHRFIDDLLGAGPDPSTKRLQAPGSGLQVECPLPPDES